MKEFDPNFDVKLEVVYNKQAFEKTLEMLNKQTDLLSNDQYDKIMESNEFMRKKTFQILFGKYMNFKINYINIFYAVVISSN